MRGHPDRCMFLENASTLCLSLSRAKDIERDVVHLPGKQLFFSIGKTSRSWREICTLWLEDLSGAHVGILKKWLLFFYVTCKMLTGLLQRQKKQKWPIQSHQPGVLQKKKGGVRERNTKHLTTGSSKAAHNDIFTQFQHCNCPANHRAFPLAVGTLPSRAIWRACRGCPYGK